MAYFTPRGLIPREHGIGAPGILYTLHFADRWMKHLGFDERLTDAFEWATYLQNANHLYWKVKSEIETGGDLELVILCLETFGYTGARKILTGREQPAPKLPNRKRPGRHRHPEIVVFLIAMRDIFDAGAQSLLGPTRGKGWSRNAEKARAGATDTSWNTTQWQRVLTEFETMATEWLHVIDPSCDSRLSTTVVKQAKELFRHAGRVMDEKSAKKLRELKRDRKNRARRI